MSTPSTTGTGASSAPAMAQEKGKQAASAPAKKQPYPMSVVTFTHRILHSRDTLTHARSHRYLGGLSASIAAVATHPLDVSKV